MKNRYCYLSLFLVIAHSALAADESVPVEPFDPVQVFRATTVSPTLDEQPRPWIDRTGKNAVVATLVGQVGIGIVFDRADGNRIVAHPDSLSIADRGYAIQATAPRVNPAAQVWIGRVISIRDGDTIQLRTIDEQTITIRLDRIDAPEKHQDYGLTATEFLNKIQDRTVRVECLETDRYQRVLGHVYLADRWVNYELALAGLAWHYTRYNDDLRLAAAHAFAKTNTRGLWQQLEKIAPWDYRNGVRKKTVAPLNVDSIRETDTVVYVTASGHHFHTEDCRHVKKSAIAMPLSRAVSAYERCSVCKPPTQSVAE